MPELTLYYRPMCPFCRKVLQFMEENSISFSKKDVGADSKNLQDLQGIGGKTQVPCLVIDGKALYESNDIIRWLKENPVTS